MLYVGIIINRSLCAQYRVHGYFASPPTLNSPVSKVRPTLNKNKNKFGMKPWSCLTDPWPVDIACASRISKTGTKLYESGCNKTKSAELSRLG